MDRDIDKQVELAILKLTGESPIHMKYSLLKGISKALVAVIVFGVPFLTTSFPETANLTLGAIGILLVNYVKVKATHAGFIA